jgi:hypothetical protein
MSRDNNDSNSVVQDVLKELAEKHHTGRKRSYSYFNKANTGYKVSNTIMTPHFSSICDSIYFTLDC